MTAGQTALTAVNDQISPLQAQLDIQKKLEEQEWVDKPQLHGTYSADFRMQQEML